MILPRPISAQREHVRCNGLLAGGRSWELLEAVDQKSGRIQRVAVAELIDNFDEYGPSITKAFENGGLSQAQNFTLTIAIRAHLQRLIGDEKELPALSAAMEMGLLRLAAEGQRATRLNARAVLKVQGQASSLRPPGQLDPCIDRSARGEQNDADHRQKPDASAHEALVLHALHLL